MWLINVKTRLLQEYFGNNIPPYAILSHTWEEEEVTYKQYVSGNYQWLKGYRKINMTCRIAAKGNIGYAWVDTCCIDKSSSAELSEAINSMYRWYKRAEVCYVYLADLDEHAILEEDLGKCRWFTRGWTLQELIAPTNIKFFDSEWNSHSGHTKRGLVELLAAITGIEKEVLVGERDLGELCVAQKMSWAAGRKSTRIEDESYCLLGIFNLHMPLLYGEEEGAFQRLQEEIIRSTADLSILAWTIPRSQLGWESEKFSHPYISSSVNPDEPQLCGMLAKSPNDFSGCGQYQRTHEGGLREFSISNIGLRTRIRLQGITHTENSYSLSLPLHCSIQGVRLGLRLKQVSRLDYLRQDPWQLHSYGDYDRAIFSPSERFLLTHIPKHYFWSGYGLSSVPHTMEILRKHVAQIQPAIQVPQGSLKSKLLLRHPWPTDRYDHEDNLFFVSRDKEHDFGIIDVSFEVTRYEQCAVKATLVTIGWSEGPGRAAQFSLVDHNKWASTLTSIRNRPSEEDYTSGRLADLLKRSHIPRANFVQRQIEGTSLMAVLSIKPERHEREPPYKGVHYNLKISASIMPVGQGPVFEHLTWSSFPD